MKKTAFLRAATTLLFSVLATTGAWAIEGLGTAESPWLIATADDLADFSKSTSYWASGKYTKLANDIDFSTLSGDKTFQPIGTNEKPFSGHFDGQNFTISNLNFSNDGYYRALFAYNNGTIEKVVLNNCRIEGTSYLAGIAAHNKGTIQHCHVKNATITTSNNYSAEYGGVVSYNESEGTISYCTSDATVTFSDVIINQAHAGGIVGSNFGKVYNCTYFGNYVRASTVFGAIVGNNDGEHAEVSYCYYTIADCTGGSKTDNCAVGYNGNGAKVESTSLVVLDNQGNGSFFSQLHNQIVPNVTLYDHVLYKDGDWNTLCLPFELSTTSGILEGAEARYLSGASLNNGLLCLTFSEPVTTLEAHKPHIIKWATPANPVPFDGTNGATTTDLYEPTFTNVTFNSATNDTYIDLGEGRSITFIGIDYNIDFPAERRDILFLGANNNLYYPNGNANTAIGSCRAYFKLTGITAGDPSNPSSPSVKAFNLVFGDESPTRVSLPTEREAAGGWYSLDGRRLSGKPSRSGVYVNNGRKVVID